MATSAIIGHGITLQRNSVTVAEVRDVNGPNLTRASLDATHQQSPDKWSEFIKGLKDGGDVSFDVNWLMGNATHDLATGMLGDLANDSTIDTWSIAFPSGVTWSFPAFITAFNPTGPMADVLRASITLKVAGKPTLA